MRNLLLLSALFITASAQATPFEKGDVNKGKALVEKQCVACHISMYKGDGSSVYTRADRKVKNATQLATRVSGCNANTGAGWFPEDEVDVSAHLNKTYYKFK